MNTGIFGEGFPYSNFHDLNMDWIIKIAKDFLDQYTHIQEIIEQGKTDIQDLTNSGLEQLQDKADDLEALLQAWYNEHSEDIANQLADALADLNTWYNEHSEDIADQLAGALSDISTTLTSALSNINSTLSSAISTFNSTADAKAENTIASIPSDYTTVANEAHSALSMVNVLYDQIPNIEQIIYSGAIPQQGWIGHFTPDVPLKQGDKIQVICQPNYSYIISFRQSGSSQDEQVTNYYGTPSYPVITLEHDYESVGLYSDNGISVSDTTYTLIINKNESPNKNISLLKGITDNGTYSYHQVNNLDLRQNEKIGIKVTKNNSQYFDRYILYYSKNPNPSSSDFIEATAEYFYENEKEFTVPDFYRAIRIVVNTTQSETSFNFETYFYKYTNNVIDNAIIKEITTPKTFSVLGDSWSAYKKYLDPNTNRAYYPPWETDVDGQGNNSNVTDSYKMWWYQLEKFQNMIMRQNNSYSGSPICYDGSGSGTTDAKTISFANRITNMIDSDYFIIMGGLNDQRYAVTIGNDKYSQWSDTDLGQFRPALCFIMDYIKNRFPKAKIIFAIPQPVTGNYKTAIEDVCQYYNVTYFTISGMTYLSDHPDEASQQLIARQISHIMVK